MFRMVDLKQSQGVDDSFTLYSVYGLLLKALKSFALFCFSGVVNGVLLEIKHRT
jgi:hypothetical protein